MSTSSRRGVGALVLAVGPGRMSNPAIRSSVDPWLSFAADA